MQHVAAVIKSAQIAKKRLEEEKDLTPAEVSYLKQVIKDGENAQRIMDRWQEGRDKWERENSVER